jgi:hypothetical protein
MSTPDVGTTATKEMYQFACPNCCVRTVTLTRAPKRPMCNVAPAQ